MVPNFDLPTIVDLIANVAPGRYNLKELLGVHWGNLWRPKHQGKLFKRWVLEGKVPRVRLLEPRSDRSQEYEVSVQ